MKASPKLVARIVHLEQTMAERGLTPMLHATPAAFSVFHRSAPFINGYDPHAFFKSLRPSTSDFMISRDESASMIPSKKEEETNSQFIIPIYKPIFFA